MARLNPLGVIGRIGVGRGMKEIIGMIINQTLDKFHPLICPPIPPSVSLIMLHKRMVFE